MKSTNSFCYRYLPIICLLLLVNILIDGASLFAQTGSATSEAVPSYATPSLGDQIEVTINIDVTNVNPPDEKLGSFTGTLDWNSGVLAYNSNSGILSGFTGVVNVSSGHIAFNGANPSGATGNITVLRITFDVVGPGTSILDLEYSAMAAATTFNSLLPILTVNDGEVRVVPEIEVQGNSIEIVDGDATPSVTDNTDFGNVPIPGGTHDHTFTIYNTGTADLTITTPVTITGTHAADFTVTTQPGNTVTPGSNTTFTVQFAPSAVGLRSATINITNSDADENPYDFAIQGTGTVPSVPEIEVQGNSIEIVDGDATPTTADDTDFGNALVDGGTVDHTFTIYNTGTADLTITTPVTITGTHAADFTVTAQPANTVTPGGNTTFTVRFDPSAVGLRSAAINISNNDADENPYYFAIQGTGTEPDIAVNPPSKDYGIVVIDSSESHSFWVKNEGTADLNVTGETLVGGDSTEFSIDQGQVPFTLAPGDSHEVVVSFNPTSEGTKATTLQFTSNDPDENPFDVSLSGTGTVPDIPDIIVNPTSWDYGDVVIDSSSSKSFWVKNEGTADLNVTGEALVGGDSTEFSIDQGQVPFTLAPGDSHEVVVSFNPTSEGTKATTLQFTSNDPDENPFDITLTGNCTRVKVIKIDTAIPSDYALQQNYPNPFNPITVIPYQLPKSSFITLEVYNIAGQLIETLVNERRNAGYYTVQWVASKVGSGVYLFRIQAGDPSSGSPKGQAGQVFSEVKKCVFMK